MKKEEITKTKLFETICIHLIYFSFTNSLMINTSSSIFFTQSSDEKLQAYLFSVIMTIENLLYLIL